MPRYIARALPEVPGSKKTVWRVYDTQRASYPTILNGRRIEMHYNTQAAAQAVANELNGEA